ncbi:LysR family transcriptional regulator [Sporolactobacillus spathodeae]|uniref:DNA-binding transcriptional LysR family regulator n=1 Tax=Sporolactobacillus spathodeae TaxID=1465502 RepID=A0ABS2QA52_9BACL|nr:LysR family transcriptional regulator [Sporolactobacillus spathodeae]MBM7658671.1 DNA-binding transcriptional LysR family regulator [Sporolactobacillus spathodeae]
MVDFEWYRSFVAIYKYNSVSEAAKIRIMTQPAMSQHLSSLEAEVGERLFMRTARKMMPTERGKQLYSQVAPLVESLEETTLSFKAACLPTLSTIRIGSAIEYFSENILDQLQNFKTCTISYFGEADHLLDRLKEDKVDLIITSQKCQIPGIDCIKLCTEQFVISAPKHLQIPPVDDLKAKEEWLLAQDWISYGLELPIIRRFWREHFKKRPIIKPIHTIPNLHLILRAIENGAGISLIPTYILKNSMDQTKAKVIFDALNVQNVIYLAYKSKNKHVPALNDILEAIMQKNKRIE